MTRPAISCSLCLAAALLAAAACTANPPAKDAPAAGAAPSQVASKPVTPEAAPPAPSTPPPAPPAADPPPPVAPVQAPSEAPPSEPSEAPPVEVVAGDAPAEASGPAPLTATSVSPSAHVVSWREVASMPADTAPQGFQYFATGVLAGEAPNFYTLDSAGAWVPAAIAAPPGPLSGHWPDEAWAVERGRSGDRASPERLRLHRLRGQARWVPQDIAGEQWVKSDELGPLRKSWNVGYLALARDVLVRVAGNGAADPATPVVRGTLLDLVESKAGELYTLSFDGERYVQIACPDEACVQANATPLPPGRWEWVHAIPRQKHSVSITLRDVESDTIQHVLHYESGGWKLEALPASLAGIWPTTDGGLWAQTADALLHRDPSGVWRDVALPEGLRPSGAVFAAMTTKMSELVVLGVRDGSQVLLATAARAQAPG